MPRRNAGVTLGFIGSGKVSGRKATTLIGDLIESEGGTARFVFPITKDHFSEGVQALADYAIDQQIDYDAVTDEASARKRDLKPYIEGAARLHRVARIPQKIVNLLLNSDNPKLVVLFEEEDEDVMKALELADAADDPVEALDLTDGLEVLELADEGGDKDDGEKDEKENEEEEEEPPRRRRAAAKDDEEEEEPEEPPRRRRSRAKDDEEEEEPEPPRRRRRAAKDEDEEPEPEEPEDEEPGDVDAEASTLLGKAVKAGAAFEGEDQFLSAIALAAVASINNIADAIRNPVKRGPGRPPGSKNRAKDD